MMTQSVMTQAVNLFGNAAGSVTSKDKKAGNSFELMFQNGMKPEQKVSQSTGNPEVNKTSYQDSDKKNKLSDAVVDNTGQIDNDTKNSTRPEETKAVNDEQNQAKETEKAPEVTAKSTEKTKDLTVDNETLEKIASMLQVIKQNVMEVLNLSEDEFTQLMTEQGFSMEDLLQPENLQQLVLADSGQTDILATLTNEDLANTMKQLVQSVEEIKNKAELDIPMEQIKSILDDLKQGKEKSLVIPETFKEKDTVVDEAKQGQMVVEPGKNKNEKVTSGEKKSEGQKEVGIEVIKTEATKESSSQTQADLQKENNQDLQTTEQFEMFLNNLTRVTTDTKTDFDGDIVKVTQMRDIANQIIEKIKVSIQPEQTSMELQLNPEHLGKVNFSVQSKNGVMTAQFIVQNDISKEAIESQLQSLRETLDQQGIKVGAIEVTVASYSFEQNQKEQAGTQEEARKSKSGTKITMEDALAMTEDIEEQAQTTDTSGVRGGLIDYTA